MRIGFDNDKYLKMQSDHIRKRIADFGDKLYLEFGGKLFDDYHASRVLPGFVPDSKLQMLQQLKEQVEIVVVISADAIETGKMRGDLGITYDEDVLRLIDAFQGEGFHVGSVVITQYNGESQADQFRKRLQQLDIRTCIHHNIEGYPGNIEHIVSEDGYGKNDYIETSRPLVVVTAPGPGSGKMATCLSQLYHEHKRGVKAGYAKFETFPIWNLPLRHPVNIAYEAATANLNDVNMIDPFHLEAYGVPAVNYNRDIEVYPVLNAMLEHILGENPYNSPTDMGVNMAGNCIIDDDVCREAAKQEIVRRYYSCLADLKQGIGSKEVLYKLELLMKQAGIRTGDRKVIRPALEREESTGHPAVAIELQDGRIVTGKTSDLLGASAAAVLNAVKELAGIDHGLHLVSPQALEPIQTLKTSYLGSRNPRLHSDEILIALSVSAAHSEPAQRALEALSQLKGCELHSTVLLPAVDENVFRKLGLNVTAEPKHQYNRYYHKK
ncbi:DUF1846 domain-containing protein [Anaerotalea alkaliphila]|uniref:UPF0371 protein GXN74_08905 n=1 Tax=Anaerotalea alkaliphila TaxID=2662126 RepID=A0A7X5HWC8_9FIRM|nr:DUF1846 domain-containing protein [Anaerotalea alkaliphila]NDL67857.1 DUF1846 domain-containing protein [Anaerotalea alkaliphila]